MLLDFDLLPLDIGVGDDSKSNPSDFEMLEMPNTVVVNQKEKDIEIDMSTVEKALTFFVSGQSFRHPVGACGKI